MSRKLQYSVLAWAAVFAAQTGISPSWAQADAEEMPWHQGVSEKDREEALGLLDQAAALTEQLLFTEAIAKYQEALARWEHPEIRFELARVSVKAGQPVEAWNHLQKVWQWGPDALIGDDRDRARALEQTLLREHLAIVEIVCDQPGVAIAFNGDPLFHSPGEHRRVVSPGVHMITAQKSGHFSVLRSIALAAGSQGRVSLQLSSDKLVERRRWTRWKPWAVVGAGAAVAVAGMGVQLHARQSHAGADDDFQTECQDRPVCEPFSGGDIEGDAIMQNTIGIGTAIAGGVIVATGLTMVILNRPRSHRTENRSRAPMDLAPIYSPIVAPSVFDHGAGFTVRLDF